MKSADSLSENATKICANTRRKGDPTWSRYSITHIFRNQGQDYGMTDKTPLDSRYVKETLVTALHVRAYTWQVQLSYIKRFSPKRFFDRRPASDEKSSTSMKANDPASLKKKSLYKRLYRGLPTPFLQIDFFFHFSLFFFLIFSPHLLWETSPRTSNENSTSECRFYVRRRIYKKIYAKDCVSSRCFLLD